MGGNPRLLNRMLHLGEIGASVLPDVTASLPWIQEENVNARPPRQKPYP
jgi:hypothetical protein